jgi:hypothetical protein
MPVKKKTLLTEAFISLLLLSAVGGTQLVNLVRADTYEILYIAQVPPDSNTEPPKIEIFSPENNTSYNTSNIDLHLKVSVGDSATADSRFLWNIQYEADWQPERVCVYELNPDTNMPLLTEFSTAINFTGVSDGKHTVRVYATERGRYIFYVFEISGSSSVSFTVDTEPPKVSILSLENKTYSAASIHLNFTTSEQVSHSSYSLDGQQNVTITGNTTLTGLSNEDHNVTIYAIDEAGNIGASDTIHFTVEVPEPFPAIPVAAASVIVVLVGAGLLVYFKKRKH